MDEIKYHKDYFSKRMFDIRHYKNFDKKILTGNEIYNYLKKYNYIIDLYDYYDKIMEKLIEILKGKKRNIYRKNTKFYT